MTRLLFRISEVFEIAERGSALLPGFPDHEIVRRGDPLRLRRPDGSEEIVHVTGLEHICPNPSGRVIPWIEGPRKNDIPAGTEVMLADRPAAEA